MRLTAATLIAASFAAVLIGTAQAGILIKIDKSTQRMTVVQGGEPLYNWVVSTGRTGTNDLSATLGERYALAKITERRIVFDNR